MTCSFFENCVEGEGPVVEQIIDVDDFEGIKLERNITVYLTQADVQKVTIVSPQNIIDLLLTEVKSAKGRHDPCVVPRAVPIIEAMTALVLADFWLLNRTRQI